MSMITRAVLAGDNVIGVVDVFTVKRGVTEGEEGVSGWVRSKPVLVEWSQKFEALPMTARR